MKIKLDENMPVRLADVFRNMKHEASTVFDESISGCNDGLLWNECQKEGLFLITQDLDFSDIRKYRPGTHCGVMLVRLQSPSRRQLLDKVGAAFQSLVDSQIEGCFVVLTDKKIRITRQY